MKVYFDFINYCTKQHDQGNSKSLNLLLEDFKTIFGIHEFNVSEFIQWKTKIHSNQARNNLNSNFTLNGSEKLISIQKNENDLIVAQFFAFPFLRDILFVEMLKDKTHGFANQIFDNLESFILGLQMNYYTNFINPLFNSKIINLSSTASLATTLPFSKCPFSRTSQRIESTNCSVFASESLSKTRYSIINTVHIVSDVHVNNKYKKNKTIRIIKSGSCSNFPPADYQIYLNGKHEIKIDSDPLNFFVLFPTTLILPLPLETKIITNNPQDRLSPVVFNELVKVCKILTASDMLFLFPSKVIIIDPNDLDHFLNMAVYMNILDIPFGPRAINNSTSFPLKVSKCLKPSFIEPYLDVLSINFIQSNRDLFVFD